MVECLNNGCECSWPGRTCVLSDGSCSPASTTCSTESLRPLRPLPLKDWALTHTCKSISTSLLCSTHLFLSSLSIIHWYTGLCSYTFSDLLASIHVLFCLYQVGTFQKIIHSQFQCNKFENGSDLENLIRNNFKILVLNLFKYYIP